jgi:thiamine kinase-like enzyme
VQGWPRLAARAPALAELLSAIHAAPGALADAMRSTPATFLHGDWKMGNLGTHSDGRTILLDWAYPGSGPACWDLCWYLALNQARLPESKEATIDRFRAALEAGGVATGSWWDAQLDLCLIAIMATFGWEKALGDDAELSWWESAVTDAAERQGIAAAG